MTTRRSFLAALAAGAAALGLTQFGHGSAVGEMSSRTPGEMPAAPPIRGVPGVTYFRAPEDNLWGDHLFLDGRDVTCEASEADLVAGWVRMYHVTDRSPDGRPKAFAVDLACNTLPQYVAFGRVELRPVFPTA